MDAARFDNFARSLSAGASRRTLLGLATLALIAPLPPRTLEARKRRRRKKHKRPKVVLNEFGCVNVGGACRGNDALCCSGICEGKKPKKGKRDKSRCVAHDEGGCLPNDDVCRFAPVSCGPEGAGTCFLTTGGAGYCASNAPGCEPCQTDADCEPNFGPDAACVVCEILCPEILTICASANG